MEKLIESNSHTFDIRPYLVDRGWVQTPSPFTIQRSIDNSGDLKITSYIPQPDKLYYYSLYVSGLTQGSIIIKMNGVSAPPITTNGFHEGTVLSGTDTTQGLVIWADSNGTLSNLSIKPDFQKGFNTGMNTITWSEQRKGWVTFKDFIPESGFSMYTNMFTLKDGALWKHTVDATPNNFYGEQFSSRVKFVVSSVGVKTYNSIAVHADKILGTTENGITTELGNVTDLITFDFDTREGIHYANKLRDAILDDKLKGRYIVVELTDEENNREYFQLFKIVFKSEISTPSE